MATPTYTRTNMRSLLNSRVHGKLDNLIDADEILNSAVRIVLGDIDIRSSKRRATLAPNVFDNNYSYTLPTDVKGNRIIDLIPQVKYERKPKWDLVTEDYFEREKEYRENLIAIADDDLDRRLLISRIVKDESVVIAQFETINGDGDTWSGFGTTNDSDVKTDADDYVEGNGAVRFQDDTSDLAGTTVGIQNKGLDSIDLSNFMSKGSAFVKARLVTGDTNITQLNLIIGSDTSNYYTISDSTTNENGSFVNGWNNVRLDLSNKIATGSPVDTAFDYVALYWTKTAGQHINDTDYGFDNLVIAKGQIHDLLYYSRYWWRNSSGTYLENSSANTDYLNASNDELELVITKAQELASIELRDYDDFKIAKTNYKEQKDSYLANNPSEALVLIEQYHDFSTAPINYKGFVNDTSNT